MIKEKGLLMGLVMGLALFCILENCLPSVASQKRMPLKFSNDDDPSGGQSTLIFIPAGEFLMGDHHNLGGREHRNDEVPVHKVILDAFMMGRCEITNAEYILFLNESIKFREIYIKNGQVFSIKTDALYCDLYDSEPASSITFDHGKFQVFECREKHPVVCIRWIGAAAYCNWLSKKQGLSLAYDLSAEKTDYSSSGYRLPSEAEWEYAGRGGLYAPYAIFPWGDEPDVKKANWPGSDDPWENSQYAHTTPVGFYNGETHYKKDFHWPAALESYVTHDGKNGFGLFDMAGNVWEWTNDIYNRDYYRQSPDKNPQGSARGSPMPDGKTYRTLRGGNWYNGEWGHSRVSNRDPAYFRGPKDPNHPWYHVGFRVVLPMKQKSGEK